MDPEELLAADSVAAEADPLAHQLAASAEEGQVLRWALWAQRWASQALVQFQAVEPFLARLAVSEEDPLGEVWAFQAMVLSLAEAPSQAESVDLEAHLQESDRASDLELVLDPLEHLLDEDLQQFHQEVEALLCREREELAEVQVADTVHIQAALQDRHYHHLLEEGMAVISQASTVA